MAKKGKIKNAPSSPRMAHESPLARLVRKEVLNIWEHQAADEIIAAFQISQGLPVARDASLGIPSEMRTDAADDGAARRSDVLSAYVVWRSDMVTTSPYVAVCGTLFHEVPLRQIERTHGWRNGSANGYLLAGLRHYASLRGNVPAWARDWKFPSTGSGSKNR